MFTIKFWRDVSERSISTFAQALAAVYGVDTLTHDSFADIDHGGSFTIAAVAAGASILKAVALAQSRSDANTGV